MILLCEHPVARGCESAQSRLRSSSRRPGAPAGCSRCERCPDTRWLVERLHRRVIQVRFPESWSSTFSGEKAVLTHRPGYFCLDNAFALIEGTLVFENVGKVPPPATLVFGNLEKWATRRAYAPAA